MKTEGKPNRTLRLILLLIALGLIVVAISVAWFGRKPWIIPAMEKSRKNPLTASPQALNEARVLYDRKCSDCHGDGGKGDGSEAMMYDPAPANLTDAAHISKLTDGEIYFQITEGRKPMPSFKTKLTEEQRWQLVLLVRAFANGTAPGPPPAAPEPKQASPEAPKTK